jgi:alcohol dehydrogenase
MFTIFNLKNPVNLFFGEGSLSVLREESKGLGNKALIVTGKNSARRYGMLDDTINELKKAGIESIPFEEVTPNPLSTTVEKGVNVVINENCDIIVGLGGGSAMDTAKAIALTAVNEGSIVDYQPGGKYADSSPEKALPIIAITTTAGTGSEINQFAVITNAETNEKPGIGFEVIYPDIGIVDPELMLTLPKEITTDTGVDVLFHALEAYLGKGANYYSDLIASEAIKLTVENLSTVIDNGNNLEARKKMAWANTLAGKAIDIAGTLAIHGAGHPLGGHFNLTHAQTLAVLGVNYLKQNYKYNIEKYASLTKLLGFGEEGLNSKELAAKAPASLEKFLESVNRNLKISDLVESLTDEKIEELTEDTFKTMLGTIENNPKKLTKEDIIKLYKSSL